MKEWWAKRKDDVLFGILVVYVASLAVVTVDQVFGPWIFLPEMDRQIRSQISRLSGPDPQAQREAMDDLVKTKGDFAVRPLMKLLETTNSEHTRQLAVNALKSITGQNLGNNPETWKKWFAENEKEFP